MSKPDPELDARCRALAAELGLGEVVGRVAPLAGGVASDIARVELADGFVCMKFALAKLRVAADWFAPVRRGRAEFAWLALAGELVPGAAPALFGHGTSNEGFAMEYLGGDDVRLWKRELLDGRGADGTAAAVARVLARVHARSTEPGFERAPFENRDDFHALRIEPYLLHTAAHHPDLAVPTKRMAEHLHGNATALVHGDVSPKNILLRHARPVLLDAECATMGDPLFDVAFCINHLVLKAAHDPARAAVLLGEAAAFWAAYAPSIAWEPRAPAEARLAEIVPMLMLARVDGKSPVEYLDGAARDAVRGIARHFIARPASTFPALLAGLTDRISPT